jgi:hypothetical protein
MFKSIIPFDPTFSGGHDRTITMLNKVLKDMTESEVYVGIDVGVDGCIVAFVTASGWGIAFPSLTPGSSLHWVKKIVKTKTLVYTDALLAKTLFTVWGVHVRKCYYVDEELAPVCPTLMTKYQLASTPYNRAIVWALALANYELAESGVHRLHERLTHSMIAFPEEKKVEDPPVVLDVTTLYPAPLAVEISMDECDDVLTVKQSGPWNAPTTVGALGRRPKCISSTCQTSLFNRYAPEADDNVCMVLNNLKTHGLLLSTDYHPALVGWECTLMGKWPVSGGFSGSGATIVAVNRSKALAYTNAAALFLYVTYVKGEQNGGQTSKDGGKKRV